MRSRIRLRAASWCCVSVVTLLSALVFTGCHRSEPARTAAEPPASPAFEKTDEALEPPDSAVDETAKASEATAEELAAVELACERIGGKLGSVSVEDCLDLGLRTTGGTTVEGLPILFKEYAATADREPLGRALLIGGIHGDEFAAISIMFKWMRILDDFNSGLLHWRIVPALNPDGLLKEPGQRMNANGVDLNRNFPVPDWSENPLDFWQSRTSKSLRRYPGAEPLSEPESRWLAEEIKTFKPDVVISVHAPLEIVDYDGPPKPPKSLGPLLLQRLGTYPGSLGRWAGQELGIPVITIELPRAGTMPTPAEQREIWLDLVEHLRTNLRARLSTATAAMGDGP